jgi:lipid kinase YegS
MSAGRLRMILNGQAAQDQSIRDAVEGHRNRGLDLSVRVTWEGGDAARHAREAVADGVDSIVAGGGDGTLNEVCGALADTELDAEALPSVGVLPLGTANDFATSAGIPLEPPAALDLALHRPAVPVDLLRVLPLGGRPRWCVNVATGGFGTEVTTETNPTLKKLLGSAAYLFTGLARFNSVRSSWGRFDGPDFQWEGEFLVLGLGNGKQAGGGHRLCPAATVDDGRMDVMILPSMEQEEGSLLGTLLSEGRAGLMEIAIIARLPWLEIGGTEGLTLNLDGEPVQADGYRVEVAPGRIRMHLPRTSPLLSTSPAREEQGEG